MLARRKKARPNGTVDITAAPPGSIVETVYCGMLGWYASGTCYRLDRDGKRDAQGRLMARARFTGEPVPLHPSLQVRLVDPKTIDGF